MPEHHKPQVNKSWQDPIDPGLKSRLMLPMTRPGMLDHQLTNSVTDRIQNMTRGPQLALDVNQRWQARDNIAGKSPPIVFAKPASTESSPAINAQPKSTPASAKSVVQAKKVAQARKAKPAGPSQASTPISSASAMTTPGKKPTVVQAKKVAPSNKSAAGIQKQPIIRKENQGGDKPGIPHDHLVQRKSKSTTPELGKLNPKYQNTQSRSGSENPVSSKGKNINPSDKPPVRSPSSDSNVIQRQVVHPLVSPDHPQSAPAKTQISEKAQVVQKSEASDAIRVQPRPNSRKNNDVIQRSADLPVVTEIKKNSWPKQHMTSTPSSNGFKSPGQKPNTRTIQSARFAKKSEAANMNPPASQPGVIQRMPIKSAPNTNDPSSRTVIQRVEQDSGSNPGEFSAAGKITDEDMEKLAEKVENKLLGKLDKPVDADVMLEKMERSFMRKLAIENERRGWHR